MSGVSTLDISALKMAVSSALAIDVSLVANITYTRMSGATAASSSRSESRLHRSLTASIDVVVWLILSTPSQALALSESRIAAATTAIATSYEASAGVIVNLSFTGVTNVTPTNSPSVRPTEKHTINPSSSPTRVPAPSSDAQSSLSLDNLFEYNTDVSASIGAGIGICFLSCVCIGCYYYRSAPKDVMADLVDKSPRSQMRPSTDIDDIPSAASTLSSGQEMSIEMSRGYSLYGGVRGSGFSSSSFSSSAITADDEQQRGEATRNPLTMNYNDTDASSRTQSSRLERLMLASSSPSSTRPPAPRST